MKRLSNHHPLILASTSPRRKTLLEQAGVQFEIVPSRFEEARLPLDRPDRYTIALAEGKAHEVAHRYPQRWILAADTIVCTNGTILGKPDSRACASEMLALLSGSTHQVYTAFSVLAGQDGSHHTEVVSTDVTFKSLSKAEIDWYIETNEPFDKAGAYAIQGIGAFLVKHINGSYTNVVGLPICEVVDYLTRRKLLDRSMHNG